MNDRKRLLVVGSDGLIGRALFQHLFARKKDVLGTTRRSDHISNRISHLDLALEHQNGLLPKDISVAFFCAGITNQQLCREQPSQTTLLNVTRTIELAQRLAREGVFMVFFSTNLVFDGKKPLARTTDDTHPMTEYSRQKNELEKVAKNFGDQAAILRLSKVVHSETPLFQKWVKELRAGKIIHPLTDLICSPISLDFVVRVADKVAERRASGIFQISGERDVSYADIALRLAHELQVDEKLVQPRSSRELDLQLEHLPQHTTMDVSELKERLDLIPPSVATTMDVLVKELAAL